MQSYHNRASLYPVLANAASTAADADQFDSISSTFSPSSSASDASCGMMKLYTNNNNNNLCTKSVNSSVLCSPAASPASSTSSSADYSEWNCSPNPAFSTMLASNKMAIAPPEYGAQTVNFNAYQQLDQFVRNECVREIEQACDELSISADPYNWNMPDVRKWLVWMQRWCSLLPFKLDNFLMDGMSLCQLSEDDFKLRAINGDKLYAKLEIWRMAVNYFRNDSILDSFSDDLDLAPPAYHNQPPPMYPNSCGSPYSSEASYGAPSSPEGWTSASSNNQQVPVQASYSSDFYRTPASSPAGSSHSSMTSPTSASVYIKQEPVEQSYQPQTGYCMAPTGIMYGAQSGATMLTNQQQMSSHLTGNTSDYGSDAIVSDDDELSDDGCIVDYNHQPQMQMMQQRNASPASATSSPIYHHQYQSHHQYQMHQQPQMLQQQFQSQMAHLVSQSSQQQQPPQAQVPQMISIKSEPSLTPPPTQSGPITTAAASVNSTTTATPTVAPHRPTSSSHIHLWQFLKELLAHPNQFGSSIRWLDRSKGVFKIEDSVRVAKLWGSRKNRPAMNYDKLSRSIRQYYKKGIMKKTERSQRLVYQFCTPYSL